jgi:hypothetical protein
MVLQKKIAAAGRFDNRNKVGGQSLRQGGGGGGGSSTSSTGTGSEGQCGRGGVSVTL